MTRPSLELHPEAIAEARAARMWYAQRDHAVAAAFVGELDGAVEAILAQPFRWPAYLGAAHRFAMRRFPYAVIYRPSTTLVHVVAVAHVKRKPGYWLAR